MKIGIHKMAVENQHNAFGGKIHKTSQGKLYRNFITFDLKIFQVFKTNIVLEGEIKKVDVNDGNNHELLFL